MSTGGIAAGLTIVIPTLGRPTLADCLRSLAAGTVKPVEIIVSHQGERGALDTMLAGFVEIGVPVRYIHSDKRGSAAGRNTGAALATTEFLAFTDDDCVVDVRWAELLVAALQANPAYVITGTVLAGAAGAPSVQTDTRQRLFRRTPVSGDRLSGGNCGMTLSIFKDVGGFDERELVRYCEDNEWGHRAMSRGHPIQFLPGILVTHLHWRNDSELFDVHENYARSQGGWYGRMLRKREPIFALRLVYDLVRGLRRWAIGILRRDPARAANGRAWVVALLSGVASGLEEKDA